MRYILCAAQLGKVCDSVVIESVQEIMDDREALA